MLVASFSSRPQCWPPWFGFSLVLNLCLKGFGLILGFSLEDLVWALGDERKLCDTQKNS